jgi:hypothetical protein
VKTTIDLPATLLHRAKVTAARRRTTLKNLVVEGLELAMQSPSGSRSPAPNTPPDDPFFETDAYGVPVLKRRGVTVTDELIEKLREEEGI